jgi:hypothetical protein
MVQKPGLVIGHHITEADPLLLLKHAEKLSCKFDLLLPQLTD